MISDDKPNLNGVTHLPRRKTRILTDQERDELSRMWEAIPAHGGHRKATGSSAEGQRLPRRIAALVASGVPLYEIAPIFALKYGTVAHLSGLGRDRRRTHRAHQLGSSETKINSWQVNAGPSDTQSAPVALPNFGLAEAQLISKLLKDIQALRNKLPSFNVDLVITLKKMS